MYNINLTNLSQITYDSKQIICDCTYLNDSIVKIGIIIFILAFIYNIYTFFYIKEHYYEFSNNYFITYALLILSYHLIGFLGLLLIFISTHSQPIFTLLEILLQGSTVANLILCLRKRRIV